jgi:hypothetical protein
MSTTPDAPRWSLPQSRQEFLWQWWHKQGWVEGEYDGTLLWSDQMPPAIELAEMLYFGNPLTDQQYTQIVDCGIAPFDTIPDAGRWLVSFRSGVKKHFIPSPRTSRVVRVKIQKIAIATRGKLEVGRASRNPDGTWDAVEYDGVMVRRRISKLPNVKAVVVWLRSIRGVTQLRWVRHKKDK